MTNIKTTETWAVVILSNSCTLVTKFSQRSDAIRGAKASRKAWPKAEIHVGPLSVA